jgi:NCS1 family nucleobase:cation symporter-1
MGHPQATRTRPANILELTENLSTSPFFSRDMAPTRWADRKWGLRDIAALWISMAACIPTYMLASGLIQQGMNWWQAILTIFLGNVIVLIPMVLNAHAGTKYGIPFPVYCRASFGLLGANVPALLRALVACGWFGIQTWIGGGAIYKILLISFPQWKDYQFVEPLHSFLSINPILFACFLFFWALNMAVIYRGIESIRILLNIKAPLLIILGLALLAWAYVEANGLGNMLSQPARFSSAGHFWSVFIPAVTANVAFWATLALNIPDFTRFAYSQRDQVAGQALGLPTTMALYAFIGVAVTSAALVIYKDLPATEKDELWNPVELVSRFQNPLVHIIGLFGICLATLATNLAANVVSPANDFAHLWPRRISFRTGGLITGVIGILMQPWKLLENAGVYIDKWLVGYSLLLGAVGGVLIADYLLVRRTRLDQAGLYKKNGPYWYLGGFNPVALVSLLAGIGVCVPGFLHTLGAIQVGRFWQQLYGFAWFVSFGVAFVVYLLGMCFARS